MPSVLDQPTCNPWVRAMWAIIREVVVLPLVPVTATIGMRGRIVVGAGPRSLARTIAAASTTISSRSVLLSPTAPTAATPSSTSATARPSAWARVRLRHG